MSRLSTQVASLLLLFLTAQGCSSWPAGHKASPLPLVSSAPASERPLELGASEIPAIRSQMLRSTLAPTPLGNDWSSQTRAGREALVAGDYRAAETFFREALEASSNFRPSDIRVDVSLGNLIRLAVTLESLDRPVDSNRVLSEVTQIAKRHNISQRRIEKHRARYLNAGWSSDRRPKTRGRLTSQHDKQTGSRNTSTAFDHLIRHAARSYDVDAALIKAVVAAESNFEPRALSRVGAQGLMQLMPATARAMGVRRPFVPRENIRGGVRYLRSLLDRFEQLDHALAAYNAGPDAVLRYGGVPPYPETEEYVARVRSHYRRYQDVAPH